MLQLQDCIQSDLSNSGLYEIYLDYDYFRVRQIIVFHEFPGLNEGLKILAINN